jgi:hypothetical protein
MKIRERQVSLRAMHGSAIASFVPYCWCRWCHRRYWWCEIRGARSIRYHLYELDYVQGMWEARWDAQRRRRPAGSCWAVGGAARNKGETHAGAWGEQVRLSEPAAAEAPTATASAPTAAYSLWQRWPRTTGERRWRQAEDIPASKRGTAVYVGTIASRALDRRTQTGIASFGTW